jgi:hypothetical protein
VADGAAVLFSDFGAWPAFLRPRGTLGPPIKLLGRLVFVRREGLRGAVNAVVDDVDVNVVALVDGSGPPNMSLMGDLIPVGLAATVLLPLA